MTYTEVLRCLPLWDTYSPNYWERVILLLSFKYHKVFNLT